MRYWKIGLVLVLGFSCGVTSYRAWMIHKERSRIIVIDGPSGADLARDSALAYEASRGQADVLLYGDSLVDNWRDFPGLVERMADGKRIVNFGIGGDYIGNMRFRIQRSDFGSFRPKIVVLLAGSNNIWVQDAQPIAAELIQAANLVRSKTDASVIVCTLPGDPEGEAGRKMRDVNALIRAGGERVFDLAAIIDHQTNLTSDRIHLNASGYEKWAKAMESALH